jgi:hypothetical protein
MALDVAMVPASADLFTGQITCAMGVMWPRFESVPERA